MAKDFATVMGAAGAPGQAIVGSTSPNGLGKVLKGDVADFAIVSLDSLLSSAKGDAEWMKRAPYITRLAPETMAVIAPRATSPTRSAAMPKDGCVRSISIRTSSRAMSSGATVRANRFRMRPRSR
jgi:hypothetical protein